MIWMAMMFGLLYFKLWGNDPGMSWWVVPLPLVVWFMITVAKMRNAARALQQHMRED